MNDISARQLLQYKEITPTTTYEPIATVPTKEPISPIATLQNIIASTAH